MSGSLLPLFPLNVVLLPGSVLPLHIFEERYKEMIGQAIENQTEFGIVQASSEGILNVGCTATVAEVLQKHEDGRMDINTVGRRRFEIALIDQEKSYLRASVTFFDDDEDAPQPSADLVALVSAGMKILQTDPDEIEIEGLNVPLSFRVADKISDPDFRQVMLSTRSEAERLKHIAGYLPQVVARLQRTNHIRKISATNGHGLHKEETNN